MYISKYLDNITPSVTRLTQTKFETRRDKVQAINIAIGNVSLPMHPAMQKRMFELGGINSPFRHGVVKYSSSEGFLECQKSFLNIIASSGFSVKSLQAQITDGATPAIELCLLELTSNKRPLLIFDPIYATYKYMGERLGRSIISLPRELDKHNEFAMPPIALIEQQIKKHAPAALLIIPYDNPTGQFYTEQQLIELAKLCVKYDMWLISDEAYRELYYVKGQVSSVWGITEKQVKGISGRRISLESASKVWNACGLRVGAIVSDNAELMKKIRAEYSVYLCSNVLGQYIFGALAQEKKTDLQKWYKQQRNHYQKIILSTSEEIKNNIPGIIVNKPEAALYFIVDFSHIAAKNFTAYGFAEFAAAQGRVKLAGQTYTLLIAPIEPFYHSKLPKKSRARKQIRLSCVASADDMKKVPLILKGLFEQYK
jgi:aspartate aminotransferase